MKGSALLVKIIQASVQNRREDSYWATRFYKLSLLIRSSGSGVRLPRLKLA